MEIRHEGGAPHRTKADLLAVPVLNGGERGAEIIELDAATDGKLLREAKRRTTDLSKPSSIFVYQTHGELPVDQVALIGVGGNGRTAPSREAWRRFAGHAIQVARRTRARSLALSVASVPARERRGTALAQAIGAVAEGALLAAHPVRSYKTSRPANDLATCAVVGAPGSRAATDAIARARALADATCFARDLINEPASVVTPAHLAQVAQRLRRELGLGVRILAPRDLQRLGMGAILAVGRGSRNEPRLIEVVYKPPEGSRTARRGPIALVGKGITFDSGGLSLKPAANMEIQKRDMAGGAAVLGAMQAIAHLCPGIEVRGYVPSAENMPGGEAYRPGDVVTTHSGKTVEVVNTDAEGRLVLADALAWAASGAGSAKPRWIVDVATLTGAVTIALGRTVAGVMGNDRTLVSHLIESGGEAGEPIWELPLVDEYVPLMESLVADFRNTGDGSAGSIMGGLFLREFVDGIPWAHLDIAAVAYVDKAQAYVPRGAVGWGVRTLVDFVERIAKR
ncbi:MAG: leucyl aminopeptidase [Deltaproteobacteria bacterium]|nr:leucyl aminopeptidase [Deltaproteobacteria bacterium]